MELIHSMNFLPWREIRLRYLIKRFYFLIIFSIVAFIIIQCVLNVHLSHQMTIKNSQLTQLTLENVSLQSKLTELNELKQEQAEIEQQINKLGSLFKNVFPTTYLLNLLPRIVPDGIFLTSLDKKENTVQLSGVSEEVLLINTMIEALQRQPDITHLKINSISEDDRESSLHHFSLLFYLQLINDKEINKKEGDHD